MRLARCPTSDWSAARRADIGLLGGPGLRGVQAALGDPALEALDASAGVHQLLPARVERMAVGADLDVELIARRAGDELVAAGAAHVRRERSWDESLPSSSLDSSGPQDVVGRARARAPRRGLRAGSARHSGRSELPRVVVGASSQIRRLFAARRAQFLDLHHVAFRVQPAKAHRTSVQRGRGQVGDLLDLRETFTPVAENRQAPRPVALTRRYWVSSGSLSPAGRCASPCARCRGRRHFAGERGRAFALSADGEALLQRRRRACLYGCARRHAGRRLGGRHGVKRLRDGRNTAAHQRGEQRAAGQQQAPAASGREPAWNT